MNDFGERVAVVTGAANGIGRGIVDRCQKEGMKVVLADVEEEALKKAEGELKAAGADTLAVLTDVSKAEDIESLAKKVLDSFGAVDLLFNNAGVCVSADAAISESTLADWEWLIGVNLWGVIHCLRTFVPIMLQQGTEGHIVNTSSIAGLMSTPGMGIYHVTKHGIVTLSETLYHELKLSESQIGVSVLCPGHVRTQILEAERNRPLELRNPSKDKNHDQQYQRVIQEGMLPEEVAEHVFKAIRENRFYIFTHPEFKKAIQLRMEDILQERNPT
jgi:NAD(P)-dependent dehydrogenase (short-subunit alcohol dehydrogenase family)